MDLAVIICNSYIEVTDTRIMLCFFTIHLSKVFDMGEEEHDIVLQKVQESKVRQTVHI